MLVGDQTVIVTTSGPIFPNALRADVLHTGFFI